jgi:uroporphyrinogen decarboxylase
MFENSLFIQSCLNQNKTGKIPIWMMRQAGRYLPEYQKFRSKYSFKQMMTTPDLATEVTLQPIHRFGMDAAILFSDILVTAEALGFSVEFIEKKGPVFEKKFNSSSQLPKDLDIEQEIPYVFQTIKNLKQKLHVPLIGFAGAPFTVAAYMVEGGSSLSLETVKKMIMNTPDTLHFLLKKLTHITRSYLEAQIKYGVDAVQLFDTWAGLLSFSNFKTFAFPYIKEIVTGLSRPVLLYTRQSAAYLELFKELPIQVLSIDWQSSLYVCRKQISCSLQGNLDPQLLLTDNIDQLKYQVHSILDEMKLDPGYIFNLGHGVLPPTSPEIVKKIVDWVHDY